MPSDAPVLPPAERDLFVALLGGRVLARGDRHPRLGETLDRIAHEGLIEHRLPTPDELATYRRAGLADEATELESVWVVTPTPLALRLGLSLATMDELVALAMSIQSPAPRSYGVTGEELAAEFTRRHESQQLQAN